MLLPQTDPPPEPSNPEWTTEIPDEAVLVRGGVMALADLEISSEVNFEEDGVYGISLWSYPSMDAAEIAEEVGRVADEHEIVLLPNSRMRQSTAGALRALGYEVIPGGGLSGHVTLVLGLPPADTDWTSLVAAFSAPEPNPISSRMNQK